MNRGGESPRPCAGFSPTIILTAPPSDYIADHEMTSLLVRDACFAASCPNYTTRQWEPAPPLAKIPHLYFVHPVEGRDRDGRPVPVDFHVDVSRVFATKRQMLACHASQRNWLLRQHGIDEYLAMQEKWGGAAGPRSVSPQAEAFRQYRGHPYPQDNLLIKLLGRMAGAAARGIRSTHQPIVSRSLRFERVAPHSRLSHDPLEPGGSRGQPRRARGAAALAELCGAYWYPIYAFIRRKGNDPDKAFDLTQDYFARLLETGVLASADHRRGRFRTFLRTDCGFFLAHHHERRRALKRGGGRTALPIDARDAEGRYLREPVDAMTPGTPFRSAWAFNLLDEVLKQLAAPGGGADLRAGNVRRASGRSSA